MSADHNERLATLESNQRATVELLNKVAGKVDDLMHRQGRPQWQAWGVLLTVAIPMFGAVVSTGYWAAQSLAVQIDGVDARSSMRHIENRERLDRVEDTARSETNDERKRNNEIERALGRIEGIIDILSRERTR